MLNFIKNMTLMQWVFGLGVLVNIELGIAHGSVSLTNMFPDAWVPHIIAWANGLGWVGGIIMTSLAGIGIIPRVPAPAAAKVLAWLIMPMALVLLLAHPAMAQQKIGGPVGHVLDKAGVQPIGAQSGGQPQGSNDAPGVVNVGGQKFDLGEAVITKVLPDLIYADALAHQNNNKITTPCLDAVLLLVKGWNAPVYAPGVTAPALQTDGTPAPPPAVQPLTMPDPHVLVALERASELLHELQPDSNISIGCGALGQATQKDVVTLLSTILSGGALGLFKLPLVPLP